MRSEEMNIETNLNSEKRALTDRKWVIQQQNRFEHVHRAQIHKRTHIHALSGETENEKAFCTMRFNIERLINYT